MMITTYRNNTFCHVREERNVGNYEMGKEMQGNKFGEKTKKTDLTASQPACHTMSLVSEYSVTSFTCSTATTLVPCKKSLFRPPT